MAGEIIKKCRSKNNKYVREGELVILRKKENELYFEFGESETNIKKRFYDDEKTLNEDFEDLLRLQKEEKNKAKKVEKEINNIELHKEVEKETNEENEEEKNKKPSYTKRSNIF